MKDKILALTKENEQLAQMADTDWLTGILNRRGTEKYIQKHIEEKHVGVMILIDVDHFKQLNDRYGHIFGDYTLKEITKILKFMILPKDILGRIGGDEFVIYMQTARDIKFIEERCDQIQKRLKDMLLRGTRFKISATFGYAICNESDDYQSLFDRADQKLIQEKSNRNKKIPKQKEGFSTGIHIDINHIQAQLAEQEAIRGGFCQDFETFKSIYRFVKRRLNRTKGNACTILFTLTDGNGDFPPLREREQQMTLLAEGIQGSLRAGDVFTQYSSGQYLVMVADVPKEVAEEIAERIRNTFYDAGNFQRRELLLHHSFPM